MPCMCGATDCQFCGPVQGYEVKRVCDFKLGRYVWINPEDEEFSNDETQEDLKNDCFP